MVLPRPAIRCFKAPSRCLLRPTRTQLHPPMCQRASRRLYSSSTEGSDHGSHKKSSDLPWLITSLAIFIPSAWYLAQPQLNKKSHGGGHGHDSHGSGDEHGQESQDGEEGGGDEKSEEGESSEGGDSQENSDDAESKEEKEGKEGEQKDEDKPEESSNDSEEQSEGSPDDEGAQEGAEKPEKKNREYSVTKEKSNSSGLEGVQFKGATTAGEDGRQTHTEKHIPDHKGFNKKRLESHYGKVLGAAENEEQDAENEDLGAASKSPGGFNTMSGKQEGLANTDTKHSTDITQSPDKSKKGDGSAETSKQKGTVDPNRPLR